MYCNDNLNDDIHCRSIHQYDNVDSPRPPKKNVLHKRDCCKQPQVQCNLTWVVQIFRSWRFVPKCAEVSVLQTSEKASCRFKFFEHFSSSSDIQQTGRASFSFTCQISYQIRGLFSARARAHTISVACLFEVESSSALFAFNKIKPMKNKLRILNLRTRNLLKRRWLA